MWRRRRHQNTDVRHPPGLLSSGRERPRRRTAEQRDEIAPLHGNTKDHGPTLNIADRQWVRRNNERRLTSESGQTQSFGDVGSMSGLPENGHGWAIYEPYVHVRYLTCAQP